MSSLSERTSSFHVAAAISLSSVAIGLVAFTTLDVSSLTALFLIELYLVANCFDTVREHELHPPASMLWMTVIFALSYLTAESTVVFLLVFAVLSLFGFGVELYNYRHETSYLRID